MKLSDKMAVVIDRGFWYELAVRMGRDFGTVYYYAPWEKASPPLKEALVGEGYPNIIRIHSLYDVLDECDLFVFPQLYFADMQEWLRRQGKRVFGAGRAEELELDRVLLRKYCEDHKIPIMPYEVVTGLTELDKMMRRRDDFHVKISRFRGVSETFHHINHKLSSNKLQLLARELGPFKEDMPFIIEPNVEGVEGGYDWINVKGVWLDRGMLGYEVKNKSYISRICDDKPPAVFDPFFYGFQEGFAELGLVSFISTEIRVTPDGEAFLLDLTTRMPDPPGSLELEMWGNLSEVIWAAAEGEALDVEPTAKYGAENVIAIDCHEGEYGPFEFPTRQSRWIKTGHSVFKDGVHYAIPDDGLTDYISLIGIGSSVEAAVSAAEDRMELIEGMNLTKKEGALEAAMEAIEKGREVGIDWPT